MILRHEREPVDAQPVENTFVAIDERSGEVLGASVIYVSYNPALFPLRPLQVRIQFDASPVPDALLGASVARAREICTQSGELSRIYVHCAPDDDALMEQLAPFGFQDNDALIRMRLALPADLDFKAPAGCAVVYDDLSDPLERKYFLERYNELFNVQHDLTWLSEFIDRQDFTRILTVASTGMAARSSSGARAAAASSALSRPPSAGASWAWRRTCSRSPARRSSSSGSTAPRSTSAPATATWSG